jgi:uncharacterized membrane protein YkoI
MTRFAALFLAPVAALAFSSAFAAAPPKEDLAPQAKVTRDQATQTALGKVPRGVIKSAELEREHGKLVWSFDVAQSGKSGVVEVQVDATTGQVVSLKHESAAEEAVEAAAEAKGK